MGAAEAALLRSEDEVAATALRFAAQLTALGEQLSDADLGGMVHRLFGLMKAHPELQGRGELVVRKVCDGLLKPSEDVRRFFATAARAIEGEEDRGFARRLVRVLNRGLLMGTETKSFRAQLRREACAREGERPELQRRGSRRSFSAVFGRFRLFSGHFRAENAGGAVDLGSTS